MASAAGDDRNLPRHVLVYSLQIDRGSNMRSISMALACVACLGVTSLPAGAAHRHHAAQSHVRPSAPTLSRQAIEDAAPGSTKAKGPSAAIVKAEILLDRAVFSPGVIDGRDGDNFKKALSAYQNANDLDRSGTLDQQTWNSLTQNSDQPVLVDYTITPDDVKGPFLPRLPSRMEDMATLPHLSYASPREGLAEKFHMGEDLLAALNPGVDFGQAGTQIVVADVGASDRDAQSTGSGGDARNETSKKPVAAKIEIDKRERSLRVLDRDGKLLGFFPASIGSTEKPAPSGEFKVRRVSFNPTYHYDPKFGFKGVQANHKFTIKPGPNNPVGLVWIDLTAPSYGIHGTPDPSKISKTQSHGCIRLTNWDALIVAHMVRRGVPVDFLD
jgi:lipoprotein-anchoring transpeptidase ErfK/SrfK